MRDDKDTDRRRRFNRVRKEQLARLVPYKSALWEELVRLLELTEERIQGILQALPGDWQQWHYKQLQGQIDQALMDMGERSVEHIRQYARSSWVAGIDLIDEPLLAAGISTTVATTLVNHPLLAAIETFMVDKIKDVAAGRAQVIKNTLGLVMMGAKTPYEAWGEVASSLKEKELWRARTIINTELSRLYNSAAYKRMDEIGDTVPGLQKQWRMGRRREHRLSHLAIRNTILPQDQPFKVGGVSMMHPHDPKGGAKETVNCSCYLVPHLAHWD